MTKCNEIMTRNPIVLEPSDTAEKAACTMRDNDIGPVLVVDDLESMHLMGMVTDRDLALRVLAENRDASATTLSEIMTRNLACCHPGDNVDSALEIMEQCQIRRIPIVDDDNRLLGIIAQADLAVRLDNPDMTAEVVEEISKEIEYKQSHQRF